tara:strand:+ start:347 stop:700 length:354 start_codon:yes stop_codon:yes gene_type:complete
MSLTRRDKKLLTDIEFNLMVSNEASNPSVKASSIERTISSNNHSYDNLDGNFRKYSKMKKYYIERIQDLVNAWNSQLSGEKQYRPETKQCKRSDCPKPNRRVPMHTNFCSECGREYE